VDVRRRTVPYVVWTRLIGQSTSRKKTYLRQPSNKTSKSVQRQSKQILKVEFKTAFLNIATQTADLMNSGGHFPREWRPSNIECCLPYSTVHQMWDARSSLKNSLRHLTDPSHKCNRCKKSTIILRRFATPTVALAWSSFWLVTLRSKLLHGGHCYTSWVNESSQLHVSVKYYWTQRPQLFPEASVVPVDVCGSETGSL